MSKGRSLSNSEWVGLHTLGVLTKVHLAPHRPYDFVDLGTIRRISGNVSAFTGGSEELRERIVTYSWDDDWRTILITLRRSVYTSSNENPLPLEEDSKWGVERIEIRGKGDGNVSGDKPKESSIIFSDRAALSFLDENVNGWSTYRQPAEDNSYRFW